jgi:hypothetical protein
MRRFRKKAAFFISIRHFVASAAPQFSAVLRNPPQPFATTFLEIQLPSSYPFFPYTFCTSRNLLAGAKRFKACTVSLAVTWA